MSCLKALISQQKLLGHDFAQQTQALTEAKQTFLALVKSVKDEEAATRAYRFLSWNELQEDLQKSIAQRAQQIVEEQTTGGTYFLLRIKVRPMTAPSARLEDTFDQKLKVTAGGGNLPFIEERMLNKRKREDLLRRPPNALLDHDTSLAEKLVYLQTHQKQQHLPPRTKYNDYSQERHQQRTPLSYTQGKEQQQHTQS